MSIDNKIDIDKPLWDQSTYIGRWKHFAFITDCRTILVSEKKLKEAKQLCDDYKNGKVPPGTQMSDIIRAKQLRDSAFHPDNGELMYFLGRMSFQLPTSVMLTTAMLTFYKSTIAVLIFQTVNQIHNAIVNYTNRSITDDYDDKNATRNAFLSAILASFITTVGCRKILHRKFARYVPCCAVIAGQMVNLPLMRQREIATGIPLFIENAEKPFMKSRVAAVKAISECVITRIIMSIPSLLFIPIIAQKIKSTCFYQRRPWITFPIEISLCGICCMFVIPTAFAIFPQRNFMKPELMKLYPPEYEEFNKNIKGYVDKLYYNKGL